MSVKILLKLRASIKKITLSEKANTKVRDDIYCTHFQQELISRIVLMSSTMNRKEKAWKIGQK